jgi:hypothetical protein
MQFLTYLGGEWGMTALLMGEVLIGVAYNDFSLDRIVMVGFAGLIAALIVIAWLLSRRLNKIKWILESMRQRLYLMR